MEFLEQLAANLARTPGVLRELLAGLSDDAARQNEGEGTWSPHDIVGHLSHGERTDWLGRTRHILEQGPEVPFTPFDREAMFSQNPSATIDERIDEFERLRKDNVRALQGLGLREEDLEREGLHPDLGRVTMRQLLTTWWVHDLNHLAQVARVLARATGDGTGPWKAYLPLL